MLITPKFGFGYCTDIFTGTPSAASPGINFTANANDADGTSVSVLAALTHDCHYLVIGIGSTNLATADCSMLLDVLVDPAGGTSWTALINDLLVGFITAIATTVGLTSWYHFPICIPAGTSIGVRARTAHTANITTGRVGIFAFGEPNRPESWWCGQNVETLGVDPATSSGTFITPGNTGSFSSWASIGSTTGPEYGAIQVGLGGSDATMLAVGYHFQVGNASVQLPGSPTFYLSCATSEQMARSCAMPLFCNVAPGTQMQARGTCSGTAEAHQVAIYGVY